MILASKIHDFILALRLGPIQNHDSDHFFWQEDSDYLAYTTQYFIFTSSTENQKNVVLILLSQLASQYN